MTPTIRNPALDAGSTYADRLVACERALEGNLVPPKTCQRLALLFLAPEVDPKHLCEAVLSVAAPLRAYIKETLTEDALLAIAECLNHAELELDRLARRAWIWGGGGFLVILGGVTLEVLGGRARAIVYLAAVIVFLVLAMVVHSHTELLGQAREKLKPLLEKYSGILRGPSARVAPRSLHEHGPP